MMGLPGFDGSFLISTQVEGVSNLVNTRCKDANANFVNKVKTALRVPSLAMVAA